ncbi:excisionase [Lacrimispora sphenoides]|uniref:excisionase n=1 Tax=Lacrimispora sphenoides TaxID=29370 RepID=UPI000B86E565|nr:excisionase [Lacrimispora sphenoides]
MKKEIPIWEKTNLTLEEASTYFDIGINKLRELTNDKDCHFVIWCGNKCLIKRKLLDEYLEKTYSI